MEPFFKELKDSSIKLSLGKIIPEDIDSKEVQQESLYISYICTITYNKEFDDKLYYFRKKALSGKLTQADFVGLNKKLEQFKKKAKNYSISSGNREQLFKTYARVKSFALLVSQILFVDNLMKEELWDKIDLLSKTTIKERLSGLIRKFSEDKIQTRAKILDSKGVEFYATLFTLQAAFDEIFIPDEDVIQYKTKYGKYTGDYNVTNFYEWATLYLKLSNKKIAVASDAERELCYNITTKWGEDIDEDTWNKMNQYYYEGKSFLTKKENFFATNYENNLERVLPQFALSKVKCAEEILTREYKKSKKETLNIVEIGAGSGSFAIDLIMACRRSEVNTSNVHYLGLEPNENMKNKLKEHLRQKIDISKLPPGWELISGSLESFLEKIKNYLVDREIVIVLCFSAHHCYYKSLHTFFNNENLLKIASCIYVLDTTIEHGWTKPYYMWVDCESPENFDNVVQNGLWKSQTIWQEPNLPLDGYAITNAWCSLRKLTKRMIT